MNKTEIKLKVVAEEIKDVLRKHDVAAVVGLHAPEHGEYFIHMNPSYSCAYVYNENELRFYSKKEDYNTKEEQVEKQRTTANMLDVLTKNCAILFSMLDPISKEFNRITEAKHFNL